MNGSAVTIAGGGLSGLAAALAVARRGVAFGGFGNLSPEPTLRRGNMLTADEAAGLQDALFGFGMRYALVSGHLAGDAFAGGDLARYEYACRQRFGRAIHASAVNRYLYPRASRRRASPAHQCRDGCDCTYCRCLREAAGHITQGDAADPVDRDGSGLADAGSARRKAC